LEGNIRELENKIERALIMSDDNTISVTDLDLLSFEYTETAEEYPLLEMEKTLSKNPFIKITETSLKPKNWVYPEPLCTEDLKNSTLKQRLMNSWKFYNALLQEFLLSL
jgi:DNA-binding NtrC family response regulator